MRFAYCIVAGLVVFCLTQALGVDDGDFSEFDDEEFERPVHTDHESSNPVNTEKTQLDDEIIDVEFEPDQTEDEGEVQVEDEFEEFSDEFESDSPSEPKTYGKEELKINKVPVSTRRHWTSYYIEIVMMFGLFIYFIAFLLGRSKNSTLAQSWYKASKQVLEDNFTIVGDDDSSGEPVNGVLMKESDHSFVLWCSGRIGVEGMMVKLKFVKRQDLVNVIQRMMKPQCDQIVFNVTFDATEMDNFILLLAQKKSANQLHKDMRDLSTYIDGKKKAEDYGFSSNYQVLSEIGEATKTFLSDSKLLAFSQKYDNCLEYVHISDRYSSHVNTEENEEKVPETSKSLVVCFNVGKKGAVRSTDMDSTGEWTQLVLHLAEKCRKFKLTREAKLKSEKNRLKVFDAYKKVEHQKRNELAQQRREEKMRDLTEKYMNEEDPVKAKKIEEKKNKKEQQKKMSRMKAVKIKSS